jgi:hypothetical protein
MSKPPTGAFKDFKKSKPKTEPQIENPQICPYMDI